MSLPFTVKGASKPLDGGKMDLFVAPTSIRYHSRPSCPGLASARRAGWLPIELTGRERDLARRGETVWSPCLRCWSLVPR